MKNISIQIKIVFMILVVLIIVTTLLIFISQRIQKHNLLEAKKRTLALNMDILNSNIISIMLSGEAPVAVLTMAKLRNEIMDFKEVAIHRTDGSIAFNNYETLEFVNSFQDKYKFNKTERLENKIINNDSFRFVLERGIPKIEENKETKDMEYFYPIKNEADCHKCHGRPEDSGSLRGIAHFKISIADIYKTINWLRLYLTLLLTGSALVLAIILILLIQSLIIVPVIKIGNSVIKFGEGDLDIKVKINSKDELGKLAQRINEMFKEVKERINLSKYVSKSTDEMIKQGQILTKGRKRTLTVLFSDIRGFTRYTESNPPEVVIDNLNRILQVQANIIEKYNGDVDKFVGDEIMATFEDEYEAVQCGYEMIFNVNQINKKNKINLFIGIGINTGEVIAGNIGSKTRLEYAVIGDTINLASRLCDIAKPNMMLISDNTYDRVKNKVEAKLISGQKIKGKIDSINFYVVNSIIKD